VAEQFQQVTGNGIQPDDPRYDDPENPENREFSTFETTYDGAYDSEGNPDPENRDDQDFSWESETESSTSIVKKLGANQDVIDGLSHVTFVTGCEMSDAIAYIRYWSRSGVTPKTTVTLEQAFTLPSDALKKLDDELGDMYRLPGDFNTSYSLPEDYNPSDYFNLSEKSNKTTLTVPENTAYQSRPRQPVPTRQPSLPRLDFKAGNVFSANPSGIVQGSTSAAPSDAVWHFLFNPEELQLSSGPEYNKAETWGVSDPTNSGQPLSWRNNRNRKLTFNKVLLHGYSFGKRVDSLEKGLQDLFMAREGEGSDGPPVLEFVWGKRHFGPCVIQNIQVREKAWDKGLLVNAEVSFDLEQVPEWTINDGFVDVLRPGRQPLINDPVLPPSTQAAGASPEDEESKKNDDKKTPDGGKPVNLQECTTLSKVREDLNNLEYEIGKKLSTPLAFDKPKSRISGPVTSFPYGIPRFRFDGLIIRYAFTFLDALDAAGLDDSGNKKIRSTVVGNDCMGYNISNLQEQFKLNVDQTKSLNPPDVVKKLDNTDKFFTNKIKTCVRNVKSVLDKELKNKKCSDSPYSTPGGRLQGPGLF